MGFYEDERIRNKNKPKPTEPAPTQPVNLALNPNVSLANLIQVLRNNKYKVVLQENGIITIE